MTEDETVEIRESTDADADAWNAFVDNEPSGSFYMQYGWRNINERILGHRAHYLAAYRDNVICGVLPLVAVNSALFGKILCSMPFVNQGGPCAADMPSALALCAAAQRKADQLQVDYLELRSPRQLDTQLSAATHKVNMPVTLHADPESLFNGFAKSHRRNLRRAMKEGVELRSGGIELFPDFKIVIENLWRSLGTPMYTPDFFASVLRTFPNRSRIFAVYKDNQVVAAMLVGYGNGTAESMWGGSHPDFRHLDANYVLYWEMIRDACLQGLKRFNLGRSTNDSGGTQFKSKWNAVTEQQYWYFYRPDGGPMPQLNVGNPKFRLAIETWKRLPLTLTRLIGPPVARLIP